MFSPGQRVVIGPNGPGTYGSVICKLIGVRAVVHGPGMDGYDWEIKLDETHELVPGLLFLVYDHEIALEEGPW